MSNIVSFPVATGDREEGVRSFIVDSLGALSPVFEGIEEQLRSMDKKTLQVLVDHADNLFTPAGLALFDMACEELRGRPDNDTTGSDPEGAA